MSEYFFRLGMTDNMRRRIEDWRVENRADGNGKVPSFAEAIRALIERGLSGGKNG